jgi:hypothetical protein
LKSPQESVELESRDEQKICKKAVSGSGGTGVGGGVVYQFSLLDLMRAKRNMQVAKDLNSKDKRQRCCQKKEEYTSTVVKIKGRWVKLGE